MRVTSCKSAKDRTGMGVTLEQVSVICSTSHNFKTYNSSSLSQVRFLQELNLPAEKAQVQHILDVLRIGTRLDNASKNIGIPKYAFNLPQVMALPQSYRPPNGSFGKVQS
jgi:hypothetical protein